MLPVIEYKDGSLYYLVGISETARDPAYVCGISVAYGTISQLALSKCDFRYFVDSKKHKYDHHLNRIKDKDLC